MRALLAGLTLNQRLALLAFFLGLVALAAQPYAGGRVTLDTRELTALVGREADHVTPQELAGWIVERRSDYRLIDLREAKDFEQYRIPTAENVPLAQLGDLAIAPTEKLVLYSDGGTHGAQAWLLLKARGWKAVYNLKGGLEGWKDEVLYPVLTDGPALEDRERLERAVALSRFFGGGPRAASAGSVVAPVALPAAPSVAPPSLPAGAGAAAAPRRKKEGC